MRARVVIGANFGDEGKGLVTDYLCAREGAGVVVRFNGGSQAGHTVVTPTGQRHVFGHLGSGSFLGVPTFLSQFFIVNPIVFANEIGEFLKNSNGVVPRVYAHPDCLVTTFADMIINQRKEQERGDERHGSVGLGINETVNRSMIPKLKITMSDVWNRSNSIPGKIAEICDGYATYRTGSPIRDSAMIDAFLTGLWKFADAIGPAGIGQCRDPVFEGAQGLLLDQDCKEYYPHVTRSSTGIKNARALCQQAGITDIDAYYVSRTYLTRHGAGPLPGEDDSMSFPDNTNLEHPWQGRLRFAPLDYDSLLKRVVADVGPGEECNIVFTHADQVPVGHDWFPSHVARGPTRLDVHATEQDEPEIRALAAAGAK